jgi:hypothetical protein
MLDPSDMVIRIRRSVDREIGRLVGLLGDEDNFVRRIGINLVMSGPMGLGRQEWSGSRPLLSRILLRRRRPRHRGGSTWNRARAS